MEIASKHRVASPTRLSLALDLLLAHAVRRASSLNLFARRLALREPRHKVGGEKEMIYVASAYALIAGGCPSLVTYLYK